MAYVRLNALAVILIQGNLVTVIKDLNKKVIDIFSTPKNWQLDLIYQKCG